jgi:hypothetical protein
MLWAMQESPQGINPRYNGTDNVLDSQTQRNALSFQPGRDDQDLVAFGLTPEGPDPAIHRS